MCFLLIVYNSTKNILLIFTYLIYLYCYLSVIGLNYVMKNGILFPPPPSFPSGRYFRSEYCKPCLIIISITDDMAIVHKTWKKHWRLIRTTVV